MKSLYPDYNCESLPGIFGIKILGEVRYRYTTEDLDIQKILIMLLYLYRGYWWGIDGNELLVTQFLVQVEKKSYFSILCFHIYHNHSTMINTSSVQVIYTLVRFPAQLSLTGPSNTIPNCMSL